MALSANFLKNVINVNNYTVTQNLDVLEGQTNTVYFQIVDYYSKNRYLTQATVFTVSATAPDINTSLDITSDCVQPWADDKSVWKFSFADGILPNSSALFITITEDGVATTFKTAGKFAVIQLNEGGC